MPSKTKSKTNYPNHEIVVLAAYLAGADLHYADTEDIAIRANELAPGRFSWRKYKDQINIDAVRKRLWDATKSDRGGYLQGTEKQGWILTASGVKFAKRHIGKLNKIHLAKDRLTHNEQKWLTREKVRLMSEPAYGKFNTGRYSRISSREAERFFRIDDYVIGDLRKSRLSRLIAAFSTDAELGEAVKRIADLVPEK